MATDDVEEREETQQPVAHTDAWETVVVGGPSWLVSVAAHAIIMLLFAQVAWQLGAPELPEIQAAMEEPAQDLKEPEPPKNPDIPINPEAMAEAPDPTDEAPLPFSDVDTDFNEAPGEPSDNPTDQMPLAIPRLALGNDGAARYLPGIFGHRGGRGRRHSLLRGGGNRQVEETTDKGLWWLAQVQEPDGSWDCAKWGGRADGRVAVTGLALLAFLGAGHSDQEGKYQRTVTMACKYLASAMGDDGRFGSGFGAPNAPGAGMYGQGMATMALSEGFGMGRTPWVGKAAQKALNFIIRTQPDTGGFSYTGAGEDTSISGWSFMALKSGRICGLDVPESAFDKMKKYCREIYKPDGTSTYRTSNRDSGSEATTAIGLFCRIFLNFKKDDEMVTKPAEWVAKHGVHLNNLYYTYYATLSMFQIGGEKWQGWNKNFRDQLLAKQQDAQAGDKLAGSWPPDTCQWGKEGGRVYTTAMAILSLEVYYRFLPIYRSE